MTATVLNLANGQLPNTKTTIYTVPGSTSTIVKMISLANTNTASETVNIYYLPSGGTARRICPANYVLTASGTGAGSYLEITPNLTMGAGDAIQGSSTDATQVDYVISGVQFT